MWERFKARLINAETVQIDATLNGTNCGHETYAQAHSGCLIDMNFFHRSRRHRRRKLRISRERASCGRDSKTNILICLLTDSSIVVAEMHMAVIFPFCNHHRPNIHPAASWLPKTMQMRFHLQLADGHS